MKFKNFDNIIIIIMNPFRFNGNPHSYQLDQSMFILRDDGWKFQFVFEIK